MEGAKRRKSSSRDCSTSSSNGVLAVDSRKAKRVLRKMNYFRKNGHFDITLKIGSKRFPAHKFVLAAFSNYFQAMFIGSHGEVSLTELKLENFPESVFEDLLNYIYSDRIHINQNNVSELLQCANILKSRSLLEDCGHVLQAEMNLENCLKTYFQVSRGPAFLHEYLEEKCLLFIKSHFYDLASSWQLKQLEQQEFIMLLQDIHKVKLPGHKEDVILDGIMQWYQHKKRHRVEFNLPQLLSLVDLPSVDLNYLRSVVEVEEEMRESSQCLQLINEALWEKVLPAWSAHSRSNDKSSYTWTEGVAAFTDKGLSFISGNGNIYSRWKQPPFDPKVLSTVLCDQNQLYVSIYVSSKVWCYNTLLDRWNELPPFSTPRFSFALAKLHGQLYAVGGLPISSSDTGRSELVSALDSVLVLDDREKKWVHHSNLERAVHTADMATVNGKLYAVGGFNLRVRTFVQELDPISKQWTVVTHIPIAHWSESALELYRSQNGGYHLGPSPNFSKSLSRNIQTRFRDLDKDSDGDQEMPTAPMPVALGICAHDGGIYAIGGESANGWVSRSVFFFEPSIKRWRRKGEISKPMTDPIVAVIEGSLTVVGTQSCDFPTIERFSSSRQCWKVRFAIVNLLLRGMNLNPHWHSCTGLTVDVYVAGGASIAVFQLHPLPVFLSRIHAQDTSKTAV